MPSRETRRTKDDRADAEPSLDASGFQLIKKPLEPAFPDQDSASLGICPNDRQLQPASVLPYPRTDPAIDR